MQAKLVNKVVIKRNGHSLTGIASAFKRQYSKLQSMVNTKINRSTPI